MTNETPKQTLGAAIDKVIDTVNDFDDATKLIIIRTVCSHLSIPIGAVDPSGNLSGSATGSLTSLQLPTSLPSTERVVDIRALKDEKSPASAREMACIVAYYLQAHAPSDERKTEITTSDIDRYFKQAGFPLPKKMNQLLVDAKAAGYFDSTDRGTYKLNAVGYNLVVHVLPRRQK